MYYTAKIDSNTGAGIGLTDVLNAIHRFDPNIFLYALKYKKYDEYDLVQMRTDIERSRISLEKEYNYLVKFGENFNNLFVTEYNNIYDSTLLMLRRLKSGIAQTKKIYLEFCPRQRQENFCTAAHNKPKSAYDYSYISGKFYMLDLFPLESQPDCVIELYEEMEKFFFIMVRCIQYCFSILEQENQVRKDQNYCKRLFDEFKDKVIKELSDIDYELLPEGATMLSEQDNSAIASRNRYDNDTAWAPVGYHNHTPKEVKFLIRKQLKEERERNDLTTTEKYIFDDNIDGAHRCRYIIQHLDELFSKKPKSGRIPAMLMVVIFDHFGLNNREQSKLVDYFNYTYKQNSLHLYKTVSLQAVNTQKNALTQESKKELEKYEYYKNLLLDHFHEGNMNRSTLVS